MSWQGLYVFAPWNTAVWAEHRGEVRPLTSETLSPLAGASRRIAPSPPVWTGELSQLNYLLDPSQSQGLPEKFSLLRVYLDPLTTLSVVAFLETQARHVGVPASEFQYYFLEARQRLSLLPENRCGNFEDPQPSSQPEVPEPLVLLWSLLEARYQCVLHSSDPQRWSTLQDTRSQCQLSNQPLLVYAAELQR